MQDFLKKEKLLTPEQRKRFLKIALKFERELIKEEEEYEFDKDKEEDT